ncbi:MAG: 2-C-methyl-D-erythritol 4-phosphate cytidylyltransferase [Candidatus Omnitrophica bacterium]|nr:2-C-methyl-D-erythritol 4-phosphate cytidylyltransferase [Candidatus Omnitrophota bacterium]
MKHKNTAIILAGGTGKRMKTSEPKQLLSIASKPIIFHAIECFENDPLITDIVVVSAKDTLKQIEDLLKKSGFKKIHKIIEGGASRRESSFLGVKNVPENTQFVFIHDAARPFVSGKIIKDVSEAAKSAGAAVPAIDVKDTLVEQENSFIKNTTERKAFKKIQTPQCFEYNKILSAHEQAARKENKNLTDDSGLILAAGGTVKIVEGSSRNIKITTQTDLILAEQIAQTTS